MQVRRHDIGLGAVIRRVAGEALVTDDAQRVQVAGWRAGRSGRAFWRQVGRGSDHDAKIRHRGGPDSVGDPEVGDLQDAVIPEQQVAWLDVAVYHAGPVRRVECGGGLCDHVGGAERIKRSVVEQLGQRGAVHELHHQVRSACLAVVVDLGDARMAQRAGMPCLRAKPSHHGVGLGVLRTEHFYRYPAF